MRGEITRNFSEEEIKAIIDEKIQDGVKKYGIGFKAAIIEIIGLEKMLQPEVQEKKQTRIIPLTMWNKYHPDPSVKALRMLVFRKEENGFDKVVVRRGNRVLINEDEYFKWADNRKSDNVE